MVPQGKVTRWWLILTCLALEVLLVLAAIFGFYLPNTLAPLIDATGGLVSGVFVVGLIGLVVIVGGLLFGVARLRPQDVGLRPSRLLAGFLLTVLAWLALQLVVLIVSLIANGGLVMNPIWTKYSVGFVLGYFLLNQILGNSLHEEIIWRGFLVPQLLFQFRRLRQRPVLQGVVVLLASQALFALYHIPIQLYQGTSPGDLPLALLPLWLIGIALAFIYLRTRNLWLVIGLHALNDLPLLLFAVPAFLSGFFGPCLVFTVASILAVAWLWAWLRHSRHPLDLVPVKADTEPGEISSPPPAPPLSSSMR
jgi:CAAX protease family protein